MFKPTPSTSFGFGSASTSTPFGQSSFGKIGSTTGFGSGAFGATSAPMFGGQTQTNTGLFGQPSTTAQTAFGQPTTAQTGFAFGSPSTSTNLFNQTQQPSSSSLFGSPSNTAFGQKPAFSGFGSSPSAGIFGAAQSTQPQTNATPLFGQPSTGNTGLFGSTSAFGSPNTQTGTVVKFTPVTGTDTVIKNRITHSISTRHHCITFMKEYEAKSLEELRYEDYLANRKGPQPGTSTGNNLFVSMTTPAVGSNTLFGSTPAVSQGFGQTPSVFGQPQTSNLFGQKPPFGTTASTSSPFSFSSSATTTPFGNTGAKPFGTAAPTTGLFSTPATQSTSTFGQTNTFGNFGAQTSNTTTGFLNQNKPAAGTFNINPTNTTGFGTFGQQQSNLFGGAKPAANVFGTSAAFGQSTTTQPTFGSFGQPQQQSSLLFNNPTFNKPTTGFGVTQPTNTGLLGGFGTGQNQPTTNLFGNKTTSSIFGGTQSQTTTMPFSGFGQNTTGTGFGPLLGQPTQLSSTSLFPQQNTSTMSIHEQIVTMARPYPEIAFLKNISRTNSNKSRTTNQALLQKVLDDELKVSSKPQKVIAKVRNILPNPGMRTLFDGLEPHDASLSENIFANKPRNPRRLYLKKFPKVSGKESFEANVSTDKANIQNISNSDSTWISNLGKVKDITLAGNCDINVPQENENRDQNINNSEIKINESCDSSKISKELPVTILSETNLSNIPVVSSTTANTNQYPKESTLQSESEDDIENVDDSEKINISSSTEPHPAGIICTRAGYYTIPSLDELAKMTTTDGRCIVESFTIGRRGYGNVYFPESFDVAGINIDEHVHFRTKELIIYVDDENKPPLGQELNRPAQVTLDQVYPRDRITRESITDVDRLTEMGFENILRETCNRHGTEFIDYRPETGSWVFKVDHFTRYGFSDEDANIKLVPTTSEPKKPAEHIHQQKVNIAPLSDEILRLDSDKDDSDLEELHSDDGESLMMGPPGDIHTDRTKKKIGVASSTNRRMLAMRQAFFGDNASVDNGSIASSQVSGGILTASQYVDFLTERQQTDYMKDFFAKMYHDPDLELESAEQLEAMLRYKLEREELIASGTFSTPLSESLLSPFESAAELAYHAPEIIPEYVRDDIMFTHQTGFIQLQEFLQIFNSTKCKYDISIFKANSFRTSFVRGDQFFILNQWNQKFTLPDQSANQSVNMLYINDEFQHKEIPDLVRLSFVVEDYKYVNTFMQNIQEHLLIQQAHGDIEIDSNGFPYAFPLEGPKALHEHSEKAQTQYNNNQEDDFIVHYSVHVWKLFEALWGEILELELENPNDHLTTSTRRNYFSNWLESYMEQILRVKEVFHPEKLSIYDYVVAHKLLEASKFAFNKRNLNLSLLITNLTANIGLRRYGNNQIAILKMADYGKLIDKEIIKLYLLLAGVPVTVLNRNMKINVCENLNWLEAYALHLWYLTPIELTVTDVTNDYLRAFMEDAYAEPPFPLYTLNQNEQLTSNIPIYDLIYHVFRLYSDHTYSLEKLLNPANYTADPTDYSLSWLTLNNLKALGYTHIREISETKIHERFATQLEREGLWHWSLFVLLHIKCSSYRKKLVTDMINRNVSIDLYNDEYRFRETFATKELSIPSKYFSRAKGYKALSEKDYNVAINHFIASNDAKLVTKIFWEHIAPKEMMNRNYDYIKSLLESMIEGKYADDLHLILYEFIEIVSPIVEFFGTGKEQLISFDGKNIEDVTLSLSNICNKLVTVKINTKQQGLIISEISRDIVNYIKIILNSFQSADKRTLAVLAVWTSKLPLPDDYTIEEIKDATCLLIQLLIDVNDDPN